MRKLVTIAATALALSTLGLASTLPSPTNNGYGQAQTKTANIRTGPKRRRSWLSAATVTATHDDSFNFDRHERQFRPLGTRLGQSSGFNQFRHHVPLSYSQLTRRLQAQGYYGVRGLRKSNFGLGWRAFAFTGRGRPVMLHINPYTGRVLNVRYV